MNKGKRKRSPNFTRNEREMLLDIVMRRREALLNNKTDNASLRTKARAWKEAQEEFNNRAGCYERDLASLRLCWDNMKKRSKKKSALERQGQLATGGGPPVPSETDEVQERVKEALGVGVAGAVNIYDSDGIAQTRMEQDSVEDPLQIVEDQQEDTLLNGSCMNFSASELRSPICEVLVPNSFVEENQTFVATATTTAASTTFSTSTPPPRSGTSRHSKRRPQVPQKEPLLQARLNALQEAEKLYGAQRVLVIEQHKQLCEQGQQAEQLFKSRMEQEHEKLKQEKLKTILLEREICRGNQDM